MSRSDRRSDIAVTVLGGYLGAGKTSLVNHILRSADERIVVLVNDFGSVSIDEGLIVAKKNDKITLANGCICCSLVDGLAGALEQVRELDPAPTRLVIEASGVADPASIAAYAHGRGIELDGVVTVADAETIRARTKDVYVGDTVLRQIASADLLVINKVDLVDPDTLTALRSWLSTLTGGRPMIDAVQGKVPLDVLLGIEAEPHRDDTRLNVDTAFVASDHHTANEVFVPWHMTTDEAFDREALLSLLGSWPSDVVRVKGIVRTSGSRGEPDIRMVVHRVGLRVTTQDDGPWRSGPSQLAVIGLRGPSDPSSWEAQVRATIVNRPVSRPGFRSPTEPTL